MHTVLPAFDDLNDTKRTVPAVFDGLYSLNEHISIRRADVNACCT